MVTDGQITFKNGIYEKIASESMQIQDVADEQDVKMFELFKEDDD